MQNNELNDNLEFKKARIQFFPEDIEKMTNMTPEEKIEFKHILKSEHRYVILTE